MARVEEAVVGRRRELELVERLVTRELELAEALTIKGPPGIGKTTVWQAGLELAQTAGWRLLVARPTGAEASLSFAGLADLLTRVEDAFFPTCRPHNGGRSPQRSCEGRHPAGESIGARWRWRRRPCSRSSRHSSRRSSPSTTRNGSTGRLPTRSHSR